MPKMGSMGEFLAQNQLFFSLNQLIAFSKIIPNDMHSKLCDYT